MTDHVFTIKPGSSENVNENRINWKTCLCHQPGENVDLKHFSDQTWETFRKAAEIRKDAIFDLLKDEWHTGPKGVYHKLCYQIYTSKRNSQFALKCKMDDNVKQPVTSRPSKMLKTYDRSKCIICLEDKVLADRKTTEKLRQCLTDEGLLTMKNAAQCDSFLLKRLESGNDILYHKTCYKKLAKNLYKVRDNITEGSSQLDEALNKLAIEVEINILKSLKVISMSELKSRFVQILKDDGVDASNYKSGYLKKRLEKRFGGKLSFWKSHETSPYVVYSETVSKGQIIQAAIASSSAKNDCISDLMGTNENTNEIEDLAIHAFYSAKAIRGLVMSGAKSYIPWPPTSSSISEHSLTIPDLLYNWFVWVLTDDQSDAPISSTRVHTSEAINRRVTSFAQDIIYHVKNGKVITPKHVSLAILVKSLTGSAELVKVLNRFGHSVSYDVLEEIETAIASTVAQNNY